MSSFNILHSNNSLKKIATMYEQLQCTDIISKILQSVLILLQIVRIVLRNKLTKYKHVQYT